MVSIVIMVVGILFMILSYNKTIWQNSPYDPSVFGTGVTISALAFAVFATISPSVEKRSEISAPLALKLEEKFTRLSDEDDKVETALSVCNAVTERVRTKLASSDLEKQVTDINTKLNKIQNDVDVFLHEYRKFTKNINSDRNNGTSS